MCAALAMEGTLTAFLILFARVSFSESDGSAISCVNVIHFATATLLLIKYLGKHSSHFHIYTEFETS